MGEVRWWEEQPRLWKELVPRSGQAGTIQGELIRCTGKLTDEAYRNGNVNWGLGIRTHGSLRREHAWTTLGRSRLKNVPG